MGHVNSLRRRVAAWVICLWAIFPAACLGAIRGSSEWFDEQPCGIARDLLGDVAETDILPELLEDAVSVTLSDAIDDGELSASESVEIEGLLDSFSLPDLRRLSPVLLQRLGPSLAVALQDELRDSPMRSAKRSLEAVNDYVTSLLLPQPPGLPALESFESCAQADRFLNALVRYDIDWRHWSNDLHYATGAPGKDPGCDALDPQYYSELAATFGNLEEPMAEVALIIDFLKQSGTVTRIDYLYSFHELSELAGKIRDRLEELNRRGREFYTVEKQKKENFDSNVQLILAPAYNSRCTAERPKSRGRNGIPISVVPQPGTPVDPQSIPRPSAPPAPVRLLDTSISVSCRQPAGQKCSELWAQQVVLPRSGKLEIHYRVPPTHCSPLFFTISVDGQRASDTDLLSWHGAPSSYLRILEARVVTGSLAAGTHRVEMQAHGEKGGCNSGRLSGYGGNVIVTLH